jgi:hypothetical protein
MAYVNSERMMQRWHRTCLSKAPIRNEATAHRRAREKSAERGVKHYVYCCPYCQNWHLTKKAPHHQ